jgi:Na+/melibiose symporter-like transporter
MLILIFQFIPDRAEYGIYEHGNQAEAASFSLQTFTSFVSQAINNALIFYIIGGFEFQQELGISQPKWYSSYFSYYGLGSSC